MSELRVDGGYYRFTCFYCGKVWEVNDNQELLRALVHRRACKMQPSHASYLKPSTFVIEEVSGD